MPTGEKFDFFLSRRGSVGAMAREVADVLIERGYKVVVQDYDFPLGSDFVEAMHETLKTRATSSCFSPATTKILPIPARNSPASRPTGCKALRSAG